MDFYVVIIIFDLNNSLRFPSLAAGAASLVNITDLEDPTEVSRRSVSSPRPKLQVLAL